MLELYLKTGKDTYECKTFKPEHRDEANKLFLKLNKTKTPMITKGKGRTTFWNSTEEDWFIPFMMRDENFWEEDVGATILSAVHDLAREKYGQESSYLDTWKLSYLGVDFEVDICFDHGDDHPRGKHETYCFYVNGKDVACLSETR